MRGFLSESEKGYYDLRVNGRVFATNDWRGGISTANSSVRYKLNGVLCETLILERTTRKFLREKYFTFEFEIEMEWNPISERCDECGNGGKYMETPCDHPNDCKHWSPKLCERGYLKLKQV